MGRRHRDPFVYRHNNFASIKLMVNEKEHVIKDKFGDTKKMEMCNAYYSLLRNCSIANRGFAVTMEQWRSSFSVVCFDVTRFHSSDCSTFRDPYNGVSNWQIAIEFKKPTEDNLNLFIMMEIDSITGVNSTNNLFVKPI